MNDHPLTVLLKEISSSFPFLLISGFFGRIVKILLIPQASWKQKIIQIFSGTCAAVFLGPLVADQFKHFTPSTLHATLAAGFITGHCAQIIIQTLQNKLSKKSN